MPEQEIWTLEAAFIHFTELRRMDEQLREAHDRRYSEVSQEREKALRIKEQGDRDALVLAREIQTYKDEKANELRSQIERERGSYATQQDLRAAVEKLETALQPVQSYVTSQTGSPRSLTLPGIVAAISVLALIVGLVLTLRPGG